MSPFIHNYRCTHESMNRNLVVVALIAVVNALGYGIIIPILYPYSQQYGLSDFENGLLFSIFALVPLLRRQSLVDFRTSTVRNHFYSSH